MQQLQFTALQRSFLLVELVRMGVFCGTADRAGEPFLEVLGKYACLGIKEALMFPVV